MNEVNLTLYAKLIRDSERLQVARAYVENTKYPERDVLMQILGTAGTDVIPNKFLKEEN